MSAPTDRAPVESSNLEAAHNDDGIKPGFHVEHDDSAERTTTKQAAIHSEVEHALSIRQAVKHYRWAIIWCMLVRLVS